MRARGACEYCLLPTEGGFHIDHIIPPSWWLEYANNTLPQLTPVPERSGPDHLDNFAWCCPFCNGRKGQQLTHRIGGQLHRLFDPRTDRWPEHFIFIHEYLHIVGLTAVGQATVEALGINRAQPLYGPLAIRHLRRLRGQYPPPWAVGWAEEKA